MSSCKFELYYLLANCRSRRDADNTINKTHWINITVNKNLKNLPQNNLTVINMPNLLQGQ